MPIKTVKISAKCDDLCSIIGKDESNNQVGNEYYGYVPDWLPNVKEEHYGDYVSLEIDVETGQILNWKKPTEERLKKTFR